MDFKSRLSAFSGGGGGGNSRRGYQDGGTGNRNPHDDGRGRGRDTSRDRSRERDRDRDRSRDRDRDSYRDRSGDRDRRGGDGYRGSYSGDRRRPREYDNRGSREPYPPSNRRRYHSPDRDVLDDLRRLNYGIPRHLSPSEIQENTCNKTPNQRTKHICLLLINIDEFPYEHIWKAWSMANCDGEQVDSYGTKFDPNLEVWISLACHSKYPSRVSSPWLKKRLLVLPPKLGRGNSYGEPIYLSHAPNWGSINITLAMIDLLRDGMAIGAVGDNGSRAACVDPRFSPNRFLIHRHNNGPIPPVDQFVYISETCLPVVSVPEALKIAEDASVSWVNARSRRLEGTPKNKYEDDQFAGINRRIPGQFRWKADQWIMICRDHAKKVLDIDGEKQTKYQLWNSFRDINASDEMYFPTCLALANVLRWKFLNSDGSGPSKPEASPALASSPFQSPSSKPDQSSPGAASPSAPAVPLDVDDSQVRIKPVTYTDWSEGMRNPATFTNGISDFFRVARLARAKGCLIARKFAPFLVAPGTVPQESDITGRISVLEWRKALETMRDEDKAKEMIQAKRAAVPTQTKTEKLSEPMEPSPVGISANKLSAEQDANSVEDEGAGEGEETGIEYGAETKDSDDNEEEEENEDTGGDDDNDEAEDEDDDEQHAKNGSDSGSGSEEDVNGSFMPIGAGFANYDDESDDE